MPQAQGERLKWVRKPMEGWVLEPRVVHPPRSGPGIGWRAGRKGNMAKFKVKFLTQEEQVAILTMAAKGRSTIEIGRALGRNDSTIARFLARMADTSVLAKATLKAGAARLAERVVKQATVVEAVDVLSRPGMDVLQPAANKGSGGGFGIQVSVGVGSCGTVVKVVGGTSAQQVTEGVESRLLEDGQYPARPPARHGYTEQVIEVAPETSPDGKG
mgnify:CR=1 FL=1